MSLFISASSPTAAYKDSSLEKAVTNMAVKLAHERKLRNLPAGPSLDVSFLISGTHEKPSFTGMRMGNYSVGEKTLYFERAVPAEMLNSEKANDFVAAVLLDVIDNAADYFKEYNVQFDYVSWEKTVQSLN